MRNSKKSQHFAAQSILSSSLKKAARLPAGEPAQPVPKWQYRHFCFVFIPISVSVPVADLVAIDSVLENHGRFGPDSPNLPDIVVGVV